MQQLAESLRDTEQLGVAELRMEGYWDHNWEELLLRKKGTTTTTTQSTTLLVLEDCRVSNHHWSKKSEWMPITSQAQRAMSTTAQLR